MTSNIATLCNTLSPFQGQDVNLYEYEESFCRDRDFCVRPWFRTTATWKCRGHLDMVTPTRVRLNFCELLGDRLVIRYSPWSQYDRPGGSLKKQRRFHVLESAVTWAEFNPTWIMVGLKHSRTKQLDIMPVHWRR